MKRWLQYTAILTCGHIVLSFLTWIMPSLIDIKPGPSLGYIASEYIYFAMCFTTINPAWRIGEALFTHPRGAYLFLSLIITSTLIGGLLAGVCCFISKCQGERETSST